MSINRYDISYLFGLTSLTARLRLGALDMRLTGPLPSLERDETASAYRANFVEEDPRTLRFGLIGSLTATLLLPALPAAV